MPPFVLIAAAFASGLAILMNLGGVLIYDLSRIQAQKRQKLHPQARVYRQRPLVTVIILAHNDSPDIWRCLESVFKSNYKKVEAIVVDSASSDDTRRLVKQYQSSHPNYHVKLYAQRGSQKRPSVIMSACRKYAHGELVMLLDGASLLPTDAIRRSVAHFNADNRLAVLNPQIMTKRPYGAPGLIQSVLQVIRVRSQKTASALKLQHVIYLQGSMFKLETLLTILASGNYLRKIQRLSPLSLLVSAKPYQSAYFASDVLIYVKPTRSYFGLVWQRLRLQLTHLYVFRHQTRLFILRRPSYSRRSLSLIRLGLSAVMVAAAIASPVLISYFIYLAVKLHQPIFYALCWLAFSIFVLFSIIGNEHLMRKQKLVYVFLTPLINVFYYWLTLSSLLTIVAGLVPGKKFERRA